VWAYVLISKMHFVSGGTFCFTRQVLPFRYCMELQSMKVAYIFATDMAASYKLGSMILPQLEQGMHGVTVVDMFFFDDNLYVLRQGDSIGERRENRISCS
jgi:hypothetical protein